MMGKSQSTTKTGKARLVGFDFGTNTSVVHGTINGSNGNAETALVLSVVGYAKEAILPGVIPGGRTRLYGDEALDYRLYVDLRWPLEEGVVSDPVATKDFLEHLQRKLCNNGDEVWAVIGSPAAAKKRDVERLRDAARKVFKRTLIVPEPFLAAMGSRDESRLGKPDYVDPVMNSLIVDIGAGTTDLCIIQGYYPGAEDQISFARAGNEIDLFLHKQLSSRYPDVQLHRVSVTRLKEKHAFVGTPPKPVVGSFPVRGHKVELDVTKEMGQACESIMEELTDKIYELMLRPKDESIDVLQQNVLLTGGGSQIRGITTYLEKGLRKRGVANPRVRRAEDYKSLVAKGAYKVAENLREDQWQVSL